MAEIVYAVEMRGSGAPVEGREGVLRGAATGVGPNGEAIIFETEVVMSDDGFTESGSITLNGRGSVNFDTIGMGQMGPSPVEGLMYGTVMWKITGGDGEFAGATGHITSNFTFSEAGELVDNQYVRIFTG
ncbi:MAG: hypothetical protein QF554_08305 [Dehalococcoidia bacterium]|jgi:hypothetical protein|nr:hypothetical protein [Dehalococcoidia bacterium]